MKIKSILYIIFIISLSINSSAQIRSNSKLIKKKVNQKVTLENLSDGSIGSVVASRRLASETSKSQFYTINNKTFLFLYQYKTGVAKIYPMNNDGKIGMSPIKEYDWSSKWTTSEFYTINNQTYLFLYKYSTGTVHIHLMNNNGTIGDMIFDKKWSTKWYRVEFYTINNQTYLYLMKHSGLIRIHKMDSDGSVGNLVKEYNWSEGWTSAEFYTINNQTYLFLLKGAIRYKSLYGITISDNTDDKRPIHVHKMNTDGSVGEMIMERKWTNGWSNVEFYQKNNKTYLFISKSKTGFTRIHKVNQRGLVGEMVKEYNWGSKWGTSEFFRVNNTPYLFLKRSGTGETIINKIN